MPTHSPLLELGMELQRNGKLAEAEAVYQRTLQSSPDDSRALHYLGLVHCQLGQFESADRLLQRSLEFEPTCASTWSDLGTVQVRQERREAAIRSFVQALSIDPKHVDALNNLAVALMGLGRFEQAIVALRRLVCLKPASADPLCSLGDAYYAMGSVIDAAEAYHDALWLDQACIPARLGLAETAEARGKFRVAGIEYLAVLRRDPTHPIALAKLLQLRHGKLDPRWARKAEELAADPKTEHTARIRLHVALGAYFDSNGAYDAAFRYLKLGCDEQARRNPFDSDAYTRAIDLLIEVLTKDYFANSRSSDCASSRPIFIVGMPRSGTTLTEQILASHSQVAAAGESGAMLSASRRIESLSPSRVPYPRGLLEMTPEAMGVLANGYLLELDKISRTAARVTDKMPFNFMHIGVIAQLFPRAAIIHCRRNPLDNCLSCYFTSFADDIGFANDLGTLGRYYNDYDRLMAHWHRVLPGRIFELQYETLVEDTQPTIRKLLAHCGLSWEDDCARYFETDRGIRTPSRWQVRQPIYRNSVARWRNYREHLGPLTTGLAAALPQDCLPG